MTDLPANVTRAMESLKASGWSRGMELFDDPRLVQFWCQADELYHAGAEHRRSIRFSEPGPIYFIEDLWKCIAAKDWPMPSKNLGEKRRHRTNIAKQLHKLRTMIQSDEQLSVLPIVGLAKIAWRGHPEEYQARNEISDSLQVGNLFWAMEHTLPEVLLALEKPLRDFQPLSVWDDVEWPDDMPQVNRADRRRIWVERRLADRFTLYTGSPQTGLIADAINCAFELAPHEAVTGRDVDSRLRNSGA